MSTQASVEASARAPETVVLCDPSELANDFRVLDCIARRALELLQARGCGDARDWDAWAEAEAEFLRPVPIEIDETRHRIVVRAGVLGFEAGELKVAVEPRLIIVVGKKKQSPEIGNKVFYVDWNPDEIFRHIDLPTDVNPASATATLSGGVLEFTLQKELSWEEIDAGSGCAAHAK